MSEAINARLLAAAKALDQFQREYAFKVKDGPDAMPGNDLYRGKLFEIVRQARAAVTDAEQAAPAPGPDTNPPPISSPLVITPGPATEAMLDWCERELRERVTGGWKPPFPPPHYREMLAAFLREQGRLAPAPTRDEEQAKPDIIRSWYESRGMKVPPDAGK